MTLYHPALTQAVALEHIRDLQREAVARRVRLEAAAGAGVTDTTPRHRVPRHRPAWWMRVTSFSTRPLHAAGRVSVLLTLAVTGASVLVGAGAAWAGPAPAGPASSGSLNGRAPDGSSSDFAWEAYVGSAVLVVLVLAVAVAGSLAIARHRRPVLPST